MKDELISFETAKLAKEKGYDLSGIGVRYSDGKYDGEESYLFHKDSDTVFPCPTQSLLQRWLRSKKIWVDVSWDYITHYYYVHISLWNDGKRRVKNDKMGRMYEFKTYEDALEAGLQKALKLIN